MTMLTCVLVHFFVLLGGRDFLGSTTWGPATSVRTVSTQCPCGAKVSAWETVAVTSERPDPPLVGAQGKDSLQCICWRTMALLTSGRSRAAPCSLCLAMFRTAHSPGNAAGLVGSNTQEDALYCINWSS